MGVCPAFMLLGAWIGHIAFGTWRGWLAMWLGALTGMAMALGATFALRGPIEALSGQDAANHAVLAFFAVLVVLAALGALLGRTCKVSRESGLR